MAELFGLNLNRSLNHNLFRAGSGEIKIKMKIKNRSAGLISPALQAHGNGWLLFARRRQPEQDHFIAGRMAETPYVVSYGFDNFP